MPFGSSEPAVQSPFVVRAELALKDLKDRVTAHIHRESQIRRFYGEWQENLLSQTDLLRQHVAELEARLAPWIPRDDGLRLAVVSRSDDHN